MSMCTLVVCLVITTSWQSMMNLTSHIRLGLTRTIMDFGGEKDDRSNNDAR
jgi:hypothetical protein